MIRALALEDFQAAGDGGAAIDAPAPGPATLAEEALAAFDEGYRNGWDDCARAEIEERRRIGADLAANLRALSRTHEEVRAEVLAGLGPLFEEIAARLLPALAAEAVAPTVIAELRAAAEAGSEARAVLVVAPSALPVLERLLEAAGAPEVALRAEPAYAEGQVSLRFGAERRDIDLADAARRMAEAIRAFVAQDAAPSPHAQIRRGVA